MRLFILTISSMSLLAQDAGYLAPKLPEHIKLQPPKVTTETEKVPQERTRLTIVDQSKARCAHIIVYVPPRMDESMIMGRPDGTSDPKMPVIKGPGVCPEDVRALSKQRR